MTLRMHKICSLAQSGIIGRQIAPATLVLLATVTAFGGQALNSETQQRIDKVESCLPPPVAVKGEAPQCETLKQRMSELHISGASVAVLHNGVIEWARGYGVKQLDGPPVTPDTLFQAGSISKPVAAMGTLHLVQEGKLSLNADVNATLKSWQIPPLPSAGAVVTLKELLTHTAGMTVHGFPGYAANAPVPTLVQVLNGEPPANTPPIRLQTHHPGSMWNYSGGGITVMQQLVLDVVKQPYPSFLHDTVLAPAGMTHSTYQQPLPSEWLPRAATPYDADGKPIAGGAHTYPEMAAAGLWTTPSDIGRYMIEVQQSLAGHANHILSQAMTKQMLTPGMGSWGLGVQIGGSESNRYFTHGGVNEGYESLFVAYEHGGDGAVVMTNAQGGSRLAFEVMSAVAVAYGWPDYQPVVRTQIKVDPTVLVRYVGTYEISHDFSITITLDGDQLMSQASHQPNFPIYPESESKFFLKVVDAEVEFFNGGNGAAPYLVLHQNGHDRKGIKK